MMDLRTKGEVGVIGMVGTSGDKYEGILAHMEKKIEMYMHLDSNRTTYEHEFANFDIVFQTLRSHYKKRKLQ